VKAAATNVGDMMGKLFPITVVGLMVGAVIATSTAAASTRCDSISVHRGVNALQAVKVATEGVGCGDGRAVVRRYFRQVLADPEAGECAIDRQDASIGCSVGPYTCTTLGTYRFRGRCADDAGNSVSFVEHDFHRG
jgi:hypothetical protein